MLRKAVERIIDSSIGLLIGLVATVLSYFSDTKLLISEKLQKFFGISALVAEFVYIATTAIALCSLSYVVVKYTQRVKLLSFRRKMTVSTFAMGSADRIQAFQGLRERAASSIYVMGIGMTYFSSDLNRLKILLDKGIVVRLLMMNPLIFNKKTSSGGGIGMWISRGSFDNYFKRKNHSHDLQNSLERLIHFSREYNEGGGSSGAISIKVYDAFIPINFTIIDLEGDGEALIETALPYSEMRVNLTLSKHKSEGEFKHFIDSCENFWTSSRGVD